MSRRKGADKRVVEPDPRYNNVLVSKFTNGLMERGKKSLARRIFYDAMDIIDQRVPDEEPMIVFEQAMENVRPRVEVKSRRVGGATYQVPMEVRQTRRETGLYWRPSMRRISTVPATISPGCTTK